MDRNRYLGDVEYEVWRRGGNPDLVDPDRVENRRRDGYWSEDAGRDEVERQRRKRGYR